MSNNDINRFNPQPPIAPVRSRVGNPFERQPAQDPMSVGGTSDRDDRSAEELEKIQGMIPTPADKSTEEGFKKMMGIMGYSEAQIQEAVEKDRAATHTADKEIAKQNLARTTDHSSIFKKMEEPEASANAKVDAPLTGYNNPTSTPTASAAQPVGNEDTGDAAALPKEYKDEEVLPILDSILTRGYASESFFIKGQRVTLRTQFYWEDNLSMRLTEGTLGYAPLKDMVSSVLSHYILAANLEQFGGYYFQPLNKGTPKELEDSLQERAKFLDTLPSVLIAVLWRRRDEFFNKIRYIEQNFDKLIEAF